MNENKANKDLIESDIESNPQKNNKDSIKSSPNQTQSANLDSIESSIEPAAQKQEEPPKYREAMMAYSNATLGISMVIAVLLGVGVGLLLENLFGAPRIGGISVLFWLGVFWGVAAAILNIFKVARRNIKELNELAKDPKYAYFKQKQEDEDE